MKVISVVTLVFLPMTFVSVSITRTGLVVPDSFAQKTLMSTPIVQFDSGDGLSHRKFSPGALQLFVLLSVPLLLLTLLTWRWLNRRAEAKVEKGVQTQLANSTGNGAA